MILQQSNKELDHYFKGYHKVLEPLKGVTEIFDILILPNSPPGQGDLNYSAKKVRYKRLSYYYYYRLQN